MINAERYLAWAWKNGPKEKGSSPYTVDALAFEFGIPEEMARQWVMAAAEWELRQQAERKK